MAARILVVDDVELNVKLLEAKLTSEYFQVSTAFDGATALAHAQRDRPDVVLLDVMMPGMDGLEVCRRLKADPVTADIPVVMVTALSDIGDRLRGLEAGADDFLTKPVNDTALFARVRSLVRFKRMTDEWRLREETYSRFAALTEDPAAPTDDGAAARLVVLDDQPLSARRILDMLAAHRFVHATTNAEAAEEIDPTTELFVLTLSEQEDTLRLVAQLRAEEATRATPVLLIGEEDELPRLAKGLDLGATDYLIRPIDRNELIARVRTQVRRKRLQERLRENYERSLSLALTDSLTGLYNRRYLGAHLDGLMLRASAGALGPAILFIDIDRFKDINDTHGHPAGDAVLREVASRTTYHLRPFDLVARYGGEEFVVVMPETPLAVAVSVAERLRHAIGGELIVTLPVPDKITVTVSIGVSATRSDGGDTAGTLLKRADEALYAAKRMGRNCVMAMPEGSSAVPVLELKAIS